MSQQLQPSTIPVDLVCGRCGKPVACEMSPAPHISNLEYVSIIVVQHSGKTRCPHCQTLVMPVVAGAQQVLVKAVPIERSLIETPGGQNGRM